MPVQPMFTKSPYLMISHKDNLLTAHDQGDHTFYRAGLFVKTGCISTGLT